MTTRIVLSVLIAALMTEVSAVAQAPISAPAAKQYVDPVNGLSLEQAVARAFEQEPSLRAARSEIDVAREQEPVLGLMEKYSDVPMSLADACLVRMTEIHPDPIVLTTDADFRIYRRHSRQVVPCVTPQR